MKKIKQNILKLAACAFLITGLSSCSDKGYADYETDGTASQALNGEWFINISDEDGTLLYEHSLHKTFDDNAGKMYISDRIAPYDPLVPPAPTDFSGWWLVSKVNYDLSNLTFTANAADNEADGSVVNITEGKIFKDAAESKSGNVVDSIYFKGEFDYEPGRILIFSGHKRTGFEEDEY